jgi:uncharacterized delta-60 repeat protein
MPATLIKTFFRTYFSILSTSLILFLPAQTTIKAVGEIDPGFNAGVFKEPRGSATTVVAQPNGKVLIGGKFEVVNGFLRNSIARVNPGGSLDTTFNPPPLTDNPRSILPSGVEAIALQPDGKIIIAGTFSITGINLRAPIVRLNADGSLDASFNFAAQDSSAMSGVIKDAEIRADGKIFIAGNFSYTSPASVVGINPARLNPDGSTDDTFNTPGASLPIEDIAVQPDGKVLAGGFFSNIGGGYARSKFARLANDTAALSTLIINRTSVTLTRDGAAPQFWRVFFEQSADNGLTYTPLGSAANSLMMPTGFSGGSILGSSKGDNVISAQLAPQASSYTLTGLNLPTGQNILVRARGYFRAGTQDGSEATEDKLQTVFLLAPSAAAVSVSGRVLTSDGSGLRDAKVMLTGGGGNSRPTSTGSFGYFRFDDVQSGETYVVSVASKRYQFSPQVVTVNEELSELNFTAQQ